MLIILRICELCDIVVTNKLDLTKFENEGLGLKLVCFIIVFSSRFIKCSINKVYLSILILFNVNTCLGLLVNRLILLIKDKWSVLFNTNRDFTGLPVTTILVNN